MLMNTWVVVNKHDYLHITQICFLNGQRGTLHARLLNTKGRLPKIQKKRPSTMITCPFQINLNKNLCINSYSLQQTISPCGQPPEETQSWRRHLAPKPWRPKDIEPPQSHHNPNWYCIESNSSNQAREHK